MPARSLSEAIDHAQELVVAHRYEEGLEFLTDTIERFPGDPELRLLYGTVLMGFRPEEAPWQIATAIKLDTDDPWRLTRAAALMYSLGQYGAAQDYAARAVDFAPDRFALTGALLNVGGKLSAWRGDDPIAEEALRRAVAHEPDSAMFSGDLAEFLAGRDRLDEALAVIDDGLSRVADPQRLIDLRERLLP